MHTGVEGFQGSDEERQGVPGVLYGLPAGFPGLPQDGCVAKSSIKMLMAVAATPAYYIPVMETCKKGSNLQSPHQGVSRTHSLRQTAR